MGETANVTARLAEQGVHLQADFTATVAEELGDRSSEDLLKAVYAQFLVSDLNLHGSGCLPEDLQSQHNTVLRGRLVLQVDEVTDTAANAKQRYVEHLWLYSCWMRRFGSLPIVM